MSNRKGIAATVLVFGLLAGLGFTALATDNPQAAALSAGEVPDATLNDRVETLLRTDIGLAGGQFRVQTKSGIVTLAGSVPDEHALRRALDLASSVKGVREIRNSMVVESPK